MTSECRCTASGQWWDIKKHACVCRKLLTEEKKKREAAELERQELQDRLKQFEQEREKQAAQLEETLRQTQELEQKAQVRESDIY